MSTNRRSGAWIIALISVFIVVGSLLTALLQGGYFETPGTPEPTATLRPTDSPQPTSADDPAPEATPTPSATPTQTPTSCLPPAGWMAYTTQPGDTLENLALARGISVIEIVQGNCLETADVPPGSTLFLPPLLPSTTPSPSNTPTNTQTLPPSSTSISCGPPAGWVKYTVKPGDTLFSLSQVLGVTVAQLQLANCLGNSTVIQAGQSLWVPFIPPSASRTPTPSPTHTVSPTASPSPSNTLTPQPSPTASSTPQPTQTLAPTATHTPTTMGYPPPGASPTPTGTGEPYP
jgi:LysM repeat protein